jgi:hypothetical protein
MPDQQRKDKPRFEPPPWERDAFDELARKRAEAEERERVTAANDAAAAWAAQAAAAAQAATPGSGPALFEEELEPDRVEAPTVAGLPAEEAPAIEAPRPEAARAEGAAPAKAAAPPSAEPAAGALDERLVEAMLVQLQGEEPPVAPAVGRLGKALAAAIAVIGAGMVLFSLVSLAQTTGRPLGMIGSLIVGGFGMFLVGTGIWLWVRPNAAKGRP